MSKRTTWALVLGVPLLALGLWAGGGRFLKATIDDHRDSATAAFAAEDCDGAMAALGSLGEAWSLGEGLGYTQSSLDKLTDWRFTWKRDRRADQITKSCAALLEADAMTRDGEEARALGALLTLAYRQMGTNVGPSYKVVGDATVRIAAGRAAALIDAQKETVAGLDCAEYYVFYDRSRMMEGRYDDLLRAYDGALAEHRSDLHTRCAVALQDSHPWASAWFYRALAESASDPGLKEKALDGLRTALSGDLHICALVLDRKIVYDMDPMRSLDPKLLQDEPGAPHPIVAPLMPNVYDGCADTFTSAHKFNEAREMLGRRITMLPDGDQLSATQQKLHNLAAIEADAAFDNGKLDRAAKLYTDVRNESPNPSLRKRAEARLAEIAIAKAKKRGAGKLNPVRGRRYAKEGPARLMLVNGTQYPLDVFLSGAESLARRIEKCDDCSTRDKKCTDATPRGNYELFPGTYQVLVQADSGTTVGAFLGTYDLLEGHQYVECLIIRVRKIK